MKNKVRAPKPYRRYSDVVKQHEIVLITLLFMTYAALLWLVVTIALYWR